MALPELLANWMELATVEEVHPEGAAMLVGALGKSKEYCTQPYQKALMGVLPVLSSSKEYSYSLPDTPVSVSVAVAEIVPWAWRLEAANPAATARARVLETVFIFMLILSSVSNVATTIHL
jgi:hypothetical protein